MLRETWRYAVSVLFFSVVLLAGGCEHDGAELVFDANPGGEPVSLARDIQPILTTGCAVAGCHTGNEPEALLRLDPGWVHDPELGAVGVASLEAPGLLRIAPGDAQGSYLVAKLEGRQDDVGGFGEPMPAGAPPLSDEVITLIRSWIDDGARDN